MNNIHTKKIDPEKTYTNDTSDLDRKDDTIVDTNDTIDISA